jgi:hypothetical protein
MSEDVIGKLGRFTPTAVDRDALLFAAGRASVRPARFWKWATGVLVLSQLVTLGLWLAPKPEPPPPVPVIPSVPVEEHAIPKADPYSLLALRQNPEPRSSANDSPTAPRPPLLAFARDFQP